MSLTSARPAYGSTDGCQPLGLTLAPQAATASAFLLIIMTFRRPNSQIDSFTFPAVDNLLFVGFPPLSALD